VSAPLIALTGATGFVGRAVTAELAARGLRTRVLARNPDRLQRHLDMEIVAGDLADKPALAGLCKDADAVIHIAGAIMAVNRDGYFAVNAQGAADVADAAAQAKVRRFVHVSSLAAREPDLSDYAASKRAGEHLVARAAGRMNWVMMRPPGVYGPGDAATLPLFAQLTRRFALVPGGPRARISLLHAADLARALVDAALADAPSGSIHELDDGKAGGYAWADLCAIAAAAEGHPVDPIFIPRAALVLPAMVAEAVAGLRGVPSMLSRGKLGELYHADWVARGPELPGFAPQIGFAEGFAATLAAYRNQGLLPSRRGTATSKANSDQETTLP
jgi:nucleoside-diphosphate-sugar epimerase